MAPGLQDLPLKLYDKFCFSEVSILFFFMEHILVLSRANHLKRSINQFGNAHVQAQHVRFLIKAQTFMNSCHNCQGTSTIHDKTISC